MDNLIFITQKSYKGLCPTSIENLPKIYFILKTEDEKL